ncbi:MAG: kelch repeat-containing protein [Candidatus Brocadiia bacterium]
MRSNSILKIATVIMFVAYITAFNYGGCGDIGGSSGSSGIPTPTPTAPAQVTSPTPDDSATNVITTTQVSWASVSGATSYDVFFGTTSPGVFVGNQSDTNYNPGTALFYNTTYYWRIDSKNSAGTTTGNVWTFITQIAPSAQATSPSPANSTTNAHINQQLGWASASGAISYDVYFGLTATGWSPVTNIITTVYNPGTLNTSTIYYWRIDSKTSVGTTTGSVWSFTTQLAPAQATSPTPVNGAINVITTTQLSWASASGATSYDVFFGITTTGWAPITNTTGTSYNPGTLSNNTTYYWRIDSKNFDGTTTGNVWSLTTIDVPPYWTQRIPTGTSPLARYQHAIAYDSVRGITVIFGGETGVSNNFILNNETWEWDGTNWSQRTPVTSPSARRNHAMAYDSVRGVTVLFGGETNNGINHETWEWDGTNWTLRTPVIYPSARYCHGMTYDSARGVTVLFGGYVSGINNQTWEWDGTNWTQRTPVTSPSARYIHAMAYDSAQGVTVLFGGSGGSGGEVLNNETWKWNGTNWTQRTSVTSPSARHGHRMAYDSARGVTVLFGGWNGSVYNYETWEWDGTNWTLRRMLVIYPSARSSHAMAYDSVRNVTVLFGGWVTSACNNETWER